MCWGFEAMDFTPTEERRMVSDGIARLLEDKLPAEHRLQVAYTAPFHDPALWDALAEMGVPGMLATEDQGGFGGAGFDLAAVFEPLGRALCPEPLLAHGMGLAAIAACDAPDAGAVEGTARLALAVGEPAVPYGREGLETVATRGAEGWHLSGRKSVIYGGGTATSLLIAAVHGGGLGLFRVAVQDAQITAYGMVDGGGAAEVFLQDTKAELLAEDAGAALDAAEVAGITALAWEGVGVADRLVAETAEYLRTRTQFGRPIGSFQALQHRAVDMAIHARQIRSIAIRAAASMGTPQALRHAAMAKSLVGRAGRSIAEEAIQLHGGIAVTWDAEVAHLAKRLVMIDAQLGDADWHTERLAEAI